MGSNPTADIHSCTHLSSLSTRVWGNRSCAAFKQPIAPSRSLSLPPIRTCSKSARWSQESDLQRIAKQESQFRCSIVVNISACHAEDPLSVTPRDQVLACSHRWINTLRKWQLPGACAVRSAEHSKQLTPEKNPKFWQVRIELTTIPSLAPPEYF